jgi:hypothetical protein
MEQTIIIGLSVALIFFVWVWIGLTIVQSMTLAQKIEKLEAIENRLPEEQRILSHLSELRAIERNKVGSAKLILALFAVLLLASLGLALLDTRVQDLFGFDNLKVFSYFDFVVLSFVVLPTYVGLTLAGGGKAKPISGPKIAAEEKGAAS